MFFSDLICGLLGIFLGLAFRKKFFPMADAVEDALENQVKAEQHLNACLKNQVEAEQSLNDALKNQVLSEKYLNACLQDQIEAEKRLSAHLMREVDNGQVQ